MGYRQLSGTLNNRKFLLKVIFNIAQFSAKQYNARNRTPAVGDWVRGQICAGGWTVRKTHIFAIIILTGGITLLHENFDLKGVYSDRCTCIYRMFDIFFSISRIPTSWRNFWLKGIFPFRSQLTQHQKTITHINNTIQPCGCGPEYIFFSEGCGTKCWCYIWLRCSNLTTYFMCGLKLEWFCYAHHPREYEVTWINNMIFFFLKKVSGQLLVLMSSKYVFIVIYVQSFWNI